MDGNVIELSYRSVRDDRVSECRPAEIMAAQVAVAYRLPAGQGRSGPNRECCLESPSASCGFEEAPSISGVDCALSAWCGDTAQAPAPQVGTPKRGNSQRLRKNHNTSTPMKSRISFIMTLFYS